jgi:glycosyltransferase involved in cell wall biosynthesis
VEASSAVSGFSALRVLVTHDWLVTWGGAERCLEEIIRMFPQADLLVGIRANSMRELNAVARASVETWLGRLPGARQHYRWFAPLEAVAFGAVDCRDYDLVISSSHAFAKAIGRKRTGPHVCYCYSPPRYAWDLYDSYVRHSPLHTSLALRLGRGLLRKLDLWSATRVDRFLGISEVVAERIKRIYGRSCDIVYPPIARKPGALPSSKRSDFLLSLGRLVPYKRVDLAVGAAQMLGIRLIVAGDGPERERLQRAGGRWTEFLGATSEAESARLLSECSAFVFCGEEDFGMAPLEANAHGAPVVYYNRGGVAETMRPWFTGVPFEEQSIACVAGAIRAVLDRSWSHEVLLANAQLYSPQRFRTDFARAVGDALDLKASGPMPVYGMDL